MCERLNSVVATINSHLPPIPLQKTTMRTKKQMKLSQPILYRKENVHRDLLISRKTKSTVQLIRKPHLCLSGSKPPTILVSAFLVLLVHSDVENY